MPLPGVEYDVTGHILLSAAAAALDAERLRVENVTAEVNLGLKGTAYTGNDLDQALIAVVRQVNLQVGAPAAGGAEIKSETEGERSYDYVTSADGVVPAALDATAVLMVQHLRANTPANWL